MSSTKPLRPYTVDTKDIFQAKQLIDGLQDVSIPAPISWLPVIDQAYRKAVDTPLDERCFVTLAILGSSANQRKAAFEPYLAWADQVEDWYDDWRDSEQDRDVIDAINRFHFGKSEQKGTPSSCWYPTSIGSNKPPNGADIEPVHLFQIFAMIQALNNCASSPVLGHVIRKIYELMCDALASRASDNSKLLPSITDLESYNLKTMGMIVAAVAARLTTTGVIPGNSQADATTVLHELAKIESASSDNWTAKHFSNAANRWVSVNSGQVLHQDRLMEPLVLHMAMQQVFAPPPNEAWNATVVEKGLRAMKYDRKLPLPITHFSDPMYTPWLESELVEAKNYLSDSALRIELGATYVMRVVHDVLGIEPKFNGGLDHSEFIFSIATTLADKLSEKLVNEQYRHILEAIAAYPTLFSSTTPKERSEIFKKQRNLPNCFQSESSAPLPVIEYIQMMLPAHADLLTQLHVAATAIGHVILDPFSAHKLGLGPDLYLSLYSKSRSAGAAHGEFWRKLVQLYYLEMGQRGRLPTRIAAAKKLYEESTK